MQSVIALLKSEQDTIVDNYRFYEDGEKERAVRLYAEIELTLASVEPFAEEVKESVIDAARAKILAMKGAK